MAAGSSGTVVALGAPAQRASAGESRTGVPSDNAMPSAALDENGLGYGNTATSAAVNHRATSVSGTHPVKRATDP